MKTCLQCAAPFEVTEADRLFYDKVSPVIGGKKLAIPEPTHCPSCREQIRLAWKNERKLYKRTCDLCKKVTLSVHTTDKPHPVYCHTCWWGDSWDPMDYGRDYDPNRSFFDQMKELLMAVPHRAVGQNNNEGCEYTTSTTRNRNCYLISSSGFNEECYYGIFMPRNKNCVDNTHAIDSQLLYECVDCDKGYDLAWCQNTKECSSSRFLYDCRNSHHCFSSYGLRNKEYYFRNEKCTKEEYAQRLSEIDFTSDDVVKKLKIEFSEFIRAHPRLYYEGQNNQEVVLSNHIFNSKGCAGCFDANNLEDCKFCAWYNDSKDCYDVYAFGYGNEKCYSSLEIGSNAVDILFSISSYENIYHLIYCFDCHSSQYLLGCDGLRRKKYCILNKQYTKEEYERIAVQIVNRMVEDGEWGQFFSPSFSRFAYNETMAMDFYPLTKDEVLRRGWQWKDPSEEPLKVTKIIPAAKLPDRTTDIPDDVLNWAIQCEATGRLFKLIPQELKFYRDHQLPIPHLHPDERHRRRLLLRNPRKIYDRACAKCKIPIQTTYSPERPEIVYCEACYLKEVY